MRDTHKLEGYFQDTEGRWTGICSCAWEVWDQPDRDAAIKVWETHHALRTIDKDAKRIDELEAEIAQLRMALRRVGERGEATGCDACVLEVFEREGISRG